MVGFYPMEPTTASSSAWKPSASTILLLDQKRFITPNVFIAGRDNETPTSRQAQVADDLRPRRVDMLGVNPAMLSRLDTIEDDLLRRRDRAAQEGWLGEIEGIDVTLSRLRGKRDQTLRLSKTATSVYLGIPTTASAAGQDRA
ncbi:hypothetical protein WEI85_18840 [Actinomycetes bacterium KLBMP 9797]